MQDTSHEDELLLQRHEDIGVIHHVGNEDQHTEIGGNFGSMHGSGSGTEGMEVGGDVRDIHYSGGDARGTEVGEHIGGTQHTTSNINIVTCHMAADVNLHKIDWPRLLLFLHQELLLLQVRTFQQRWTVMIHCFRIHVELQPLSWKEVHCKTLLIDGMGMLMVFVVDLNPSSYLLENFLQQALRWKSEKMDFIMMLKEYGTGLY
jgi:hypothetical protein